MKNKIKILVLLCTITISSWGQNNSTIDSLQGKWHAHEKAYTESKYNNGTTVSEVQKGINSSLDFINVTTAKITEQNLETIVDYTVENDFLYLGYKQYTIIELTTTKLTIQEVDLTGEIKYFTKIESDGY